MKPLNINHDFSQCLDMKPVKLIYKNLSKNGTLDGGVFMFTETICQQLTVPFIPYPELFHLGGEALVQDSQAQSRVAVYAGCCFSVLFCFVSSLHWGRTGPPQLSQCWISQKWFIH